MGYSVNQELIVRRWAGKDRVLKKPLRERSPLAYVLIALIPYSKPNMLLSFKPGQFFNELEKVSRYKRSTLKKAYDRGMAGRMIDHSSKVPHLTKLGAKKVAPYVTARLEKQARLMVIFDVPETKANHRRELRMLLRELKFSQVQKSVWVTDFDYREVMIEAIKELGLIGCVEVYEAARLYPKK